MITLAEEYDIDQLKKVCGSNIIGSFIRKKKGRRAGCVPTDETVRYLILADKHGLEELQKLCIDELIANDNPYSSRFFSECDELSEHMKCEVYKKKLERTSQALVKERRLKTERDQAKDTKDGKIWRK